MGVKKAPRRGAIPVSAVFIVRDEEVNLPRALESIRWCDDVVVVDSGSTDHTMDVCRRFGARVFQLDFDGFGRQKQYAVGQAKNDWILSLDADEVVTPELAAEIQDLVTAGGITYAGFWIPRSLVFLGSLLRHGGEYRKPVLRLFNRTKGSFNQARIHESVQVAGPTTTLRGEILHYSYKSIHEYFQKFNRYTSLAADDLHQRGKEASGWKIILRFPFEFVRIYIIRGLLLDGYRGFMWALFSSFYPVVKYMKLRELNREAEEGAQT